MTKTTAGGAKSYWSGTALRVVTKRPGSQPGGPVVNPGNEMSRTKVRKDNMSFEAKIPEHIKQVESNIAKLQAERRNIDWGDDGHDCDCEFCDRRGEGETDGDPEADVKAEKIDAQIKEAKHTIESLKAHAAVHKVRLEVENDQP